ncbi:MAG: hypothetical protein N2234_07880 [Planctomycetota bacterium]|nr:hypothetical protein [Planctomycetota bacterium]
MQDNAPKRAFEQDSWYPIWYPKFFLLSHPAAAFTLSSVSIASESDGNAFTPLTKSSTSMCVYVFIVVVMSACLKSACACLGGTPARDKSVAYVCLKL